MKTPLLLLVLVFSIVLAACQPATSLFSPTATTVPPTAVPTNEAVAVPPAEPTVCIKNASPFQEDPEVITVAANIPAVTETDWIKGAPNPQVTILEYSDFQ